MDTTHTLIALAVLIVVLQLVIILFKGKAYHVAVGFNWTDGRLRLGFGRGRAWAYTTRLDAAAKLEMLRSVWAITTELPFPEKFVCEYPCITSNNDVKKPCLAFVASGVKWVKRSGLLKLVSTSGTKSFGKGKRARKAHAT